LRYIKISLSLSVEVWPLVIAIFLLSSAKSQEWAFLFPEKGEVIDYWFMVRSRSLIFGLAVCILPLAIITIATWFLARPAQTKGRYYNPLISFLLCVVGIGLLIYATGLMGIQSFSLLYKDFGHFQSAKIDNRTYYVDSIWGEEMWQQNLAYFVLFECDEDGELCRNIYEKAYQPNADEYEKMTTALIPDLRTHTITLQINSETVYVIR
jgi:hypothetical protein